MKSPLFLVVSVDPASSLEKLSCCQQAHPSSSHPAKVTPARKPSEKGVWEGGLAGAWICSGIAGIAFSPKGKCNLSAILVALLFPFQLPSSPEEWIRCLPEIALHPSERF